MEALSAQTKSERPPVEGPPGGCGVQYETQDSQERVYEYYSERLAAHGWTLVEPPPPQETPVPVLITAYRNGFSYEVYAGSAEEGTYLGATVWKTSETP
jgi:hypothetical protein